MAATSTSPRSSPAPRRSPSLSGSAPASIQRGATARSAVSAKVNASINGVARRPSTRTTRASSSSVEVDDGRVELLATLKRETEEKEELLVRVQNKEQTISELTTENDNLNAALNAAESRMAEMYADQARMEEETITRLDLVDMLRAQVLELEREKRDVVRRYDEQTVTFDAERQSFFDNEQHLKSRIQSLIQSRNVAEAQRQEEIQKREEMRLRNDDAHSIAESSVGNDEASKDSDNKAANADPANDVPRDDDNEPAEMTALRLELSTLSTSYSSLQNTVQLLSSQLLDLRRVNKLLQEENESYNILLREKTINGQFDILRTVGTKSSDDGSESGSEDANEDDSDANDGRSLRSQDRMTLDPVDELPEETELTLAEEEEEEDPTSLPSRSRRPGRGGRRAAVTSRSPVSQKGESLAGLPITGPGLDLAAELGRAENQANIIGVTDNMDTRPITSNVVKNKRSKRSATVSGSGHPESSTQAPTDVDALRNEVKSLKDANKALSLYASKIIDRIVATGGFEHVLAADFDKDKSNPSSPVKPKQSPRKPALEQSSPHKKARPQSSIFSRNMTAEPLSTEQQTSTTASASISPDPSSKEKRRSLSLSDWRFSLFGSTEKKPEVNPHLRPLTLRPGTSIVGARKIESQEDEEDRRERERMNATLKLMGIEKPHVPISPSHSADSFSPPIDLAPSHTQSQSVEVSSPKPQASRFSFFRMRSSTSDTASVSSGKSGNETSNLTQDALEHAEAQTSIAALDEREKVLSAEISKGSNGGFTELPRRQRGEEWRSRRSKRSGGSASGSESTVFSAGMSVHHETDSGEEDNRTPGGAESHSQII